MKECNQPEYDLFISGPDNGQSNWPDFGTVKPKSRHKEFYAVDVDGLTVCTCQDNSTAVSAARSYLKRGHVVEVRFVNLNEVDFQQADEKRKKEFWEDFVYKPTPARTIRKHK